LSELPQYGLLATKQVLWNDTKPVWVCFKQMAIPATIVQVRRLKNKKRLIEMSEMAELEKQSEILFGLENARELFDLLKTGLDVSVEEEEIGKQLKEFCVFCFISGRIVENKEILEKIKGVVKNE